MEVNKKDYAIQLAEHNEWEAAIRERIADSESGIAKATYNLDNHLYPLKKVLTDQITRDTKLDGDTVKDMANAVRERGENNHNHEIFQEEC